jgi:hypothetical protein
VQDVQTTRPRWAAKDRSRISANADYEVDGSRKLLAASDKVGDNVDNVRTHLGLG